MTESTRVTVVIPTRDRRHLLSTAALPSALGQEDVDVDVVVVDDGSIDGTSDALAQLRDDRIRIVRHERARGVAQARNAGIAAARGDWIAFLDDDDLWSPRKLRLQLDAAAAADAAFAFGGAAAVAADRSWLYSLVPPRPEGLASTLLSRNVLWGGCSNVVARRDVLERLGGFDERLFQLSDWDLWIRLSQAGPAAAAREVVVGCIVHSGSMLLTSEEDVFEELDYLEAKHRAARSELGVRLDTALFTRWVALGHRRAGRRVRAARVYASGAFANRDPLSLARAIAALVGPRPLEPARRRAFARQGPHFEMECDVEPEWLALYRGERPRTSVQATSNASSPTES